MRTARAEIPPVRPAVVCGGRISRAPCPLGAARRPFPRGSACTPSSVGSPSSPRCVRGSPRRAGPRRSSRSRDRPGSGRPPCSRSSSTIRAATWLRSCSGPVVRRPRSCWPTGSSTSSRGRRARPAPACSLPAGSPEPRSDALAVGARLLQLLDGLEADAPVVLVVDDVQWVDQPSLKALVFALRRLVADPSSSCRRARRRGPGVARGLRRLVTGVRGSVVRLAGLDEGDLTDSRPGWASRLSRAGPNGCARAPRATPCTPGRSSRSSPRRLGAGERPLPSPRSFRRLVHRRYEVRRRHPPARRAAAVLGPRARCPSWRRWADHRPGRGGRRGRPGRSGRAATGRCRGPCHSRIRWSAPRSSTCSAGPPHGPAHRRGRAGRGRGRRVRHRVAAVARHTDLSGDLARFAEREAQRQAWPSAARISGSRPPRRRPERGAAPAPGAR